MYSGTSEQKKKKYHFFVDSIKYENDNSSITGAEIKAMITDFNPAYQLFIEGQGNDADKPVSDADGFDLNPAHGGILKFYTVPPATFGKK